VNNSPEPWSLGHSIVSEQLKRFVAEKAAQARAVRPNENDIPPEFKSLLAAAEKGDWPTLRQIFADRHEAALADWHAQQGGGRNPRTWRLHSLEWVIALEIEGAFEQFAAGVEEYAVAFGKEVIRSIPPGSNYFSGTDSAHGVITALCKSHVNADPFFTLTQNAMLDKGYLNYVRSMYESWIDIPTDGDLTNAYNEYREDARRRLKENKLLPGEDVREVEGKVQIIGMISHMAINGLVTKLTFDKNPDREFYVEEGFPLEWMYPHLSPHGLILKLSRQPLAELSEEQIQQRPQILDALYPANDW